jgi:electron transfer flavoprotein beta subunit
MKVEAYRGWVRNMADPPPSLQSSRKSIRRDTVSRKMKAKGLVINMLSAEELGAVPENIGLAGSPTKVMKVFTPPPKGKRELIEGSPDEQVDRLIERLTELKVV